MKGEPVLLNTIVRTGWRGCIAFRQSVRAEKPLPYAGIQ